MALCSEHLCLWNRRCKGLFLQNLIYRTGTPLLAWGTEALCRKDTDSISYSQVKGLGTQHLSSLWRMKPWGTSQTRHEVTTIDIALFGFEPVKTKDSFRLYIKLTIPLSYVNSSLVSGEPPHGFLGVWPPYWRNRTLPWWTEMPLGVISRTNIAAKESSLDLA